MVRSHRHVAGMAVLLVVLLLAACSATNARPLLRPNAVAVAADGSLYVMDRGNYRVVHLSPEGDQLGDFGGLGTDPDDIYRGWGLALDGAEDIYLCNWQYDNKGAFDRESVKVFSPTGRLVREIGTSEGASHEGCYSVRVDPEGRVLVVYNFSGKLRIYSAEGEQLASLFGVKGSGPGEFDGLLDVAVDSERGLLYATDTLNSRVQQFALETTASGEITATHRLSFGSYGREPGEFAHPQYLAVDEASGNIYVGDVGNLRIQVFDSEGDYVREFAPPNVELWQVMGLAVGPDGAVYAADARNNVIWVFEPDGQLRSRIEAKS